MFTLGEALAVILGKRKVNRDSWELGFVFLTSLMTIPASIMMNGWVLSVVWNWFMPAIFGLPSLTVGSAIVTYYVVGWFKKDLLTISYTQIPWRYKTTGEISVQFLSHSIVIPLLFLGVAWILKSILGY